MLITSPYCTVAAWRLLPCFCISGLVCLGWCCPSQPSVLLLCGCPGGEWGERCDDNARRPGRWSAASLAALLDPCRALGVWASGSDPWHWVACARTGSLKLLEEKKAEYAMCNPVQSHSLFCCEATRSPPTAGAHRRLDRSHVKEMDEFIVFALLGACARTGSLKLLEEKKAEYVSQCGTLSAPMYGLIIEAYGQMRDVRQVWALWNEWWMRQ